MPDVPQPPSAARRLHAKLLARLGDPFAAAIRATRMSMIVTDVRLPDNPIVFANAAFLKLTGYQEQEVLGRNCRFLQGPDTSREDIDRIRAAIAEERDVAVEILNYRKDGSPFWNALFLSPVRSATGELRYFFGSQLDVTEKKANEFALIDAKASLEAAVRARTSELETALESRTNLLHELDHRVKNNLQLMAALVRREMRRTDDEAARAALRTTLERMTALGIVHRRLFQGEDVTRFDLSEFLTDFAEELRPHRAPEETATIDLNLERVSVSASQAAAFALLVAETIADFLDRASAREGKARVSVRLKRVNGVFELAVGDPSDAGPSDTSRPRVIELLTQQLGGSIGRNPAGELVFRLPVQPFGYGQGQETTA